ncbi:FtsB family cell division protein [Blastococcus haudaquaticus]|uniref:Cell division protein FtsB n=1 Tax=Blastococcus haudaquaticus TaxID=1938745 RepID=A0A286GZV3_9ACTN|nr:septum formation initiator family protein [Blastococcus haudaquaticus]SOE01068.1 Cell division protein FtsB [Blastococcus haudaquaticus]
MSNVRGRRSGGDAQRSGGRVSRSTGRAPRVHSTRPVAANLRSSATSRPGARRSLRRAVRPTATTPRRRPLVTGPAVLLGALVLLLALTLAGPIRQYLAGQAELEQLAAEGRALDERAADLRRQLERQSDPAYAERQARERLTYVLPGDRLVVVVDGEAVEGDAGTLASTARDEQLPWHEGLMRSLADADGGPAQ